MKTLVRYAWKVGFWMGSLGTWPPDEFLPGDLR